MSILRPFLSRVGERMGEIRVAVTVASVFQPRKRLDFVGLVDTGAAELTLPLAWKRRLGPFRHVTPVDLEVADQRVVPGEVCGPVAVRINGFRWITTELVFVEMQPTRRGHEPLVGFTVLEMCNAMLDMRTHRLVNRGPYLLKRSA